MQNYMNKLNGFLCLVDYDEWSDSCQESFDSLLSNKIKEKFVIPSFEDVVKRIENE